MVIIPDNCNVKNNYKNLFTSFNVIQAVRRSKISWSNVDKIHNG